jgi:hypothetical protein
LQVDEEESGGLRGLSEVLLNYGERHFEGAPGSKGARIGLWAAVLLTCGEFERVSDLSMNPTLINDDTYRFRPLPPLGTTQRQRSRQYT